MGRGGGEKIEVKIGFPLIRDQVYAWVSVMHFFRGMTVAAHEFAWVGAYVAFGCGTVDYIPHLNVSGWKGVREFSKWKKEI